MAFSGTIGQVVATLRSGVGIQLADLEAAVYNSASELVTTVSLTASSSPSPALSPNPLVEIVDEEGNYYYELTLDVSDPVVWPGSFIRVDWVLYFAISPSPADTTTESEIYDFFPVTSLTSTKTVLSWQPSAAANLRGYIVERKYNEDTDYTYVGFAAHTSFADQASYSYIDRNRLEYRVSEVLWNPDGDPSPSEGDQVANVEIWQTDQALCLVTGTVLYTTSQPSTHPYPKFIIHHTTSPVTVGNTFHVVHEIVAPTNNFGEFGVYLIRGTIVTVEIPSVGYFRKFIVPDQAHARLVDINSTPVDSYRAE